MCSYYRWFIPDFCSTEHLINLTMKYACFQCDDTCQVAFNRSRKMHSYMVTLAYTDPTKEYRLYTSELSIDVCLTQNVYNEIEVRKLRNLSTQIK